MTKEEMEKAERNKWQEFCLKFPGLASGSFWAKLWMILWKHRNEDLVHLIWSNGFYQGWNLGIESLNFGWRYPITPPPESAPPEPKSDQPGSPGSHSSSHNPANGSPDANPSK